MTPKEISDLLCTVLKLDTFPVACGLVEKEENLHAEPLELKLNNCQLISRARHAGEYSSGIPQRMVCSIGAACAGLIRTPAEFTDGTAAVGKYTATADAGREFFRNTFKTGDEKAPWAGIQFSPLGDTLFEPMAVIVYGNPAQIMRLVHANAWNSGGITRGDTVAEAAVCSSIGLALEKRTAVLGLPCAGDRRFGGTQNHEMIFTAAWDEMSRRIAPALEEMASSMGSLYPVAPWVLCETVMPEAYTIKP